MPFKTPVATTSKATTSQDKNTNIVEDESIKDSQVVTMKQLREIVNHINNNTQALDNKVNEIGMTKVKLLSIEHFNGTRSKLKEFLLQMRFKVIQKSLKIGILMDQVVYVRLFLTGRA